MFGFSRLARRARQWRASQKRIALENRLMDLSFELRKDIGWPAAPDAPSTRPARAGTEARPML
ncbi:hypothetical protein [Hoeflea olei]|uniref:DUF1127 domain-containing protein n=1 Tax=Hoeflea olei TaxID=1480615 RepID=A0A1C1YVP0_9HYPH|nr:hypothetical protein [Hoeflea olei]OCW57584.1 hypothetical protein AWJ14_01825 [Hoeflea olei]